MVARPKQLMKQLGKRSRLVRKETATSLLFAFYCSFPGLSGRLDQSDLCSGLFFAFSAFLMNPLARRGLARCFSKRLDCEKPFTHSSECWNHLSGNVLAGSASSGADCTATSWDSPTVIFVKLLANCLPSPAQRVLPRRRVRLRQGLTRSSVSLSPASAG